MADRYGDLNLTTANTLGNGAVVNAGVRMYRKVFNFATDADGNAANTDLLHAVRIPAGGLLTGLKVSASADLSATDITVGSKASAARFVASTALPNATTKELTIKHAELIGAPLTDALDLFITPSANWPTVGTLVVLAEISHR